jgi:undecaprenyl diphosphate synthase
MTTLQSIPKHIAIVMDGNGRWAKKRLLPRAMGHREGLKATRRIIEACANAGVEVLTLFAFSSENWKRPEDEVTALMDLFINALEKEVPQLNEKGVKIYFIGDRTQFSPELQKKITEAEQTTSANNNFILNVAANYGGRWDVVHAAKRLCKSAIKKEIDVDTIDEVEFAKYLSTSQQVDPDLFIRTAGEQRISNFLMWQLAYTELYFSEVYWPDFDEEQLQLAIQNYAQRKRKFGRTEEQIEQAQT